MKMLLPASQPGLPAGLPQAFLNLILHLNFFDNLAPYLGRKVEGRWAVQRCERTRDAPSLSFGAEPTPLQSFQVL
jgi:hypothetical protein